MEPIEWPGATVVFAKDQPQYRPLPARRSDGSDGAVTSCWQLTWAERLRVLLRGRFYIRQLTFRAPLQPILPMVDDDGV